MTVADPNESAVEDALSQLRPSLAADGFSLTLRDVTDGTANVVLEAGPDACGDCMVPDDMLVTIIQQAVGDRTDAVGAVSLHKVGFENLTH
jgi:Fe-S cluster biogenesis protein NfuA